MKALYPQTSIINKLKKAFFEIFSAEGRHTKEHMFDLFLPVHAIVNKTKNGTQRLFICTKSPDEPNFDFTASELVVLAQEVNLLLL